MKKTFLNEKVIKILLIGCFSAWMLLWAIFFLRENKDGEYGEFFELLPRDLEGKRAYLLGGTLYSYLNYCKDAVPAGAAYKLAGLDPFAIEEVRAIYYLWPLKNVEQGYDYILVYGNAKVTEEGFKVISRSDNGYVLGRN